MTPARFHILVCQVLLSAPAWAATRDRIAPVEPPQLLRLQPSRSALIYNYEQEEKTITSPHGGTTQEKTWSSEPGILLGLTGSIYHPSLLDFSLDGEVDRKWRDFEYSGFSDTEGRSSGQEKSTLQHYDARMSLLKLKPYAMHLQATQQEFDRHLDFFSREEVDSQRYAARGGYQTRAKELSFNYADTNEDITGSREYERREKMLTLTAGRRVDRELSSEAEYTLRDIFHQRDDYVLQDGQSHEVRLRDRRPLGDTKGSRLNSTAYYTNQDTTDNPTQRLNWNERLTLQHRDDLRGTYQYRLNERTSDTADLRSHLGLASLRHQLFASLVSTAELEGDFTDSDNEGDTSSQTRIRASLDEVYSKQLSPGARLNLGAAFALWQNEYDSSGEDETILDESVKLSNSKPAVLSRSTVDPESIVVTDSTGSRKYEEGLDYRVVRRGGFTEIQRVIGGGIPEGSTVLIDYVSDNQPTDSFQTTDFNYSFRLTLFEDWLMFHGQLQQLRNYGNESVIFPTYTKKTLGSEAGPHWSKTGFQFDDDESDDFPYRALRVYENVSVQLPMAAMLVIDLSQQWREYGDAGDDEETLSMIAHLRSQVLPNLSLGLSGGILQEQRPTEDRDRLTLRTDMDYRYGKLEFNTSYDYNADDLDRENREEHRLWVRTKRWF